MKKSITRVAGGAIALGAAAAIVLPGAANAAPVNMDDVSLTVTADQNPNGTQNGNLYATMVMGIDWDSPNYCNVAIVTADQNPTPAEIAQVFSTDVNKGWWYVGSYGDAWAHESNVTSTAGWDAGDYKYVSACYTLPDRDAAVAGPTVDFSVGDDGQITIDNGSGNDGGDGGTDQGDGTGSLGGLLDFGSLGSLGS